MLDSDPMFAFITRIPRRYGRLRASAVTGLLLLTALIDPAKADDNRWGFGSDLGLTTGTVDDIVFTLGVNLSHYLDHNFSNGPMM